MENTDNTNWFPLDTPKISNEPNYSEAAHWLIKNFLEKRNKESFQLGLTTDENEINYIDYWPSVSEKFMLQLKEWLLKNKYETWDVQAL